MLAHQASNGDGATGSLDVCSVSCDDLTLQGPAYTVASLVHDDWACVLYTAGAWYYCLLGVEAAAPTLQHSGTTRLYAATTRMRSSCNQRSEAGGQLDGAGAKKAVNASNRTATLSYCT